MHVKVGPGKLTIPAFCCRGNANASPVSVKSWTVAYALQKVIIPCVPAEAIDTVEQPNQAEVFENYCLRFRSGASL